MIKKIILILTLSIVMFGTLFADTTSPNLQIVQSNVNPDPVKPGNDLTIDLNILNIGDEISKEVSINIDSNNIFFLKDNYLSNNLKSICSGCSYDATYYFSVKKNVTSGIYPITFYIKHDKNQISTQVINVKVEGIPDLIISKDNLENKKLFPTEEFNLELELKNVGTSDAKNIKISSNLNSIIKIGSDSTYIKELKLNDKTKVITKFKIDENLNPGLYEIPFTINFEDDFGNKHTKVINIGVEILNKAQLDIQYLKLNTYTVNIFKNIEIDGMIENVGYGEAKNIYVEANVDLEGFKKSFIGTLKKDEDSPIQFKFKANTIGKHEIKLITHYTDDFGEHTFSENLEINVTKPTSQLYLILGILGIIIIIGLSKIIINKKKKNQ